MKRGLVGLLGLLLTSLAFPAAGAMNAYVTFQLNGIDASCESGDPSFPGHAAAISVATNLTRTLQTSRVHSPVRFTKLLDQCTPLLTNALLTNQFVDATIKLVRQEPDGTIRPYFTITLTRSRILGQSLILPDTLDPASAALPALEHLTLSIQEISWRHEETGNEATDNLTAP